MPISTTEIAQLTSPGCSRKDMLSPAACRGFAHVHLCESIWAYAEVV